MTTRATAHLLLRRLPAPPRRRLVTGLSWPQHCPLGPYYDIILRHPTPYKPEPSNPQPEKTPEPANTTQDRPSAPPRKKKPGRKSSTSESSPADRARIVFGSRLLGPAEEADSAATKRAQSTTIAGVTVPPRPREPDNCCMSGLGDGEVAKRGWDEEAFANVPVGIREFMKHEKRLKESRQAGAA
ncbi:hypothetical protein GQ602_001114 [Ophiocordyceps camponoti-floridani]|uniref:Oxidoreductase-like domain-containing protein n=1 Tax=Ophiocordyceps camponoti-floridani TaxID=2030778 RepID=A0A8H4VH47_9HYPO|nr:hypothetical protein GQ602_001114 [Ophiocordyceps camponoti-floridani]